MEFEQIGKYRILGKLGQGAMGEVFRAFDPSLNRYVAVKTMVEAIGTDEELRERFHREARSAARLNHPNIITVFDFGEEQGRVYMAMELLEGSDLKEAIGSHRLTTLDQKLTLMERICDGLAFAHARDVVHRDLKPANIHIQPDGHVKIMDFGLARLGASEMTAKGMVMGTPHYMSPEQVRGEKADARSDVFSIGAVFYELLTNHKPFQADSMHAILYLVLQSDPEPMRKWAPETPQVLVDVVEKALLKDPAHRYQNGAELREALRLARRSLEPSISVAPTMAQLSSPPSARPMRIEGTAALDAAETPRPAPTFLSRAPTQVPTGTQPPASAPSRLALYIGGAGLFVAAGAVVALFLRPEPKPAGPPGAEVGLLTRQLAEREVRLAQKELQDRNFSAAVSHAEEALKLEPTNAGANEVRIKARQLEAERDTAAAEAQRAFAAGEADKASQALARLLTIDPSHPVAAELSKNLNSRFRSQAEEARRLQRRAQADAERANARGPDGLADGISLAREADALVGKAEFAVAARRFLEARASFDRARRAAEERATEAQAARATPAPMPAVTAAPPPTPVAAPVPTPPPPTAPPATLPAPAPAAVAPVPPPNEEPAIRKLVAEYGRAIETKDLDLFRSLKPNLSADEERRLRAAFQGTQSQRVTLTVTAIEIEGNRARVRVNRSDKVDDHVLTSQQTLVLVKSGSAWTIREIGK